MNIEVKIIDADELPDYGPVYGCLSGWGEDNGLWSIDLMTKDGYLRLQSSNQASKKCIDRVREICQSTYGLENPNREVEIRNGCIYLDQERQIPFKDNDDECDDVILAARDIYSWNEFTFKTDTALLEAIQEIAALGGALLLAENSPVELSNGTLVEWEPKLFPHDLSVLARLLIIRNSLPEYENDLAAIIDRFPDSISRLKHLRIEITHAENCNVFYAFPMFEHDFFDVSCDFNAFFLHQPWMVTMLLQIAKQGLKN